MCHLMIWNMNLVNDAKTLTCSCMDLRYACPCLFPSSSLRPRTGTLTCSPRNTRCRRWAHTLHFCSTSTDKTNSTWALPCLSPPQGLIWDCFFYRVTNVQNLHELHWILKFLLPFQLGLWLAHGDAGGRTDGKHSYLRFTAALQELNGRHYR